MIPALLDQEASTQEGAAGERGGGRGGQRQGTKKKEEEEAEKREINLGSLAFKSAATSNAQSRAGTETKRLKVSPLFFLPDWPPN